MSQMEPKETETPPQPRKQPRQHPSVPFVWEERPGLPKKNWQPSLATFVPSPPPLPPPIPVPVKLVTSVPFCWEKTPGELLLKLPQPPSETSKTPPLPPPVPIPVKLVTSVPFCWEETPGKPAPSSANDPPKLPQPPPETSKTPPLPPPVPIPVKLVTSVPFCWEETPGKPAPSSANDPPKLPQPPSETSKTPPLPPPVPVPVKLVTSVPFNWEETPGQPYPCFVDFNPPDPLDQPLYGCEAETSSDCFSSVPISGAFTVDDFDENLNRETSSMPTSPAYDTDDSTSSYMTGASSLVGASFLEELFPPRLPQEKVEEAASHHAQVTTASNGINFGFPVRTQYTLRELIMMSRRRSYMREHNPSMVEGREWKRYQQRLKLL
ncbi:hypothetical protein Bca52824_052050 [Brassica carinata]|uniref:Uncharacterized protein n=1 Tax=Brassica carinata TaxID=52824 RepID=A0A8X7UIC9_BRACI|nr:hypothetical protein Bca52824_052050 [Brassica carinata]